MGAINLLGHLLHYLLEINDWNYVWQLSLQYKIILNAVFLHSKNETMHTILKT